MAASINRMLFDNNILRNRLKEAIVSPYKVFALSTLHHWFSVDSSSSDDEKKPDTKSNQEKLNSKLSDLLSSIKIESSISPENSTITLNLAKPKDRRPHMKKIDQPTQKEEKPLRTSSVKIDNEIIAAAKAIVSNVKDGKEIIESELLHSLKAHAEETEEMRSASNKDISDMFIGMKIDRKKQKTPTPSHTVAIGSHHQHEHFYSQTVQEMNGKQVTIQSQPRTAQIRASNRVNLNISPTLDIFNTPMENIKTDFPKNKMWDKLAEDELQLLVKHPVRNGFEEMIRWTEEGKLWVFPIDNEYGLEEKKVSFHEHVFLEHLLEGFPERGPIRHFMELVIAGLSKNPYITVERKKEHVEWYRTYFKDKEEILKEAGVLMK